MLAALRKVDEWFCLAVLAVLCVIVFLAVIYPAGKAALIQPVEAMRHH